MRVLGIGNDLLADDAFGPRLIRAVQRQFGSDVDAQASSAAGFNLLDSVLGASRLVVVDTIATPTANPGTLHVITEEQMKTPPGGSPHFIGLFEVLAVARELGLPAPEEVVIIGVEAADCTTVGGAMHPKIEAAIPAAVNLVARYLRSSGGGAQCLIQEPSG